MATYPLQAKLSATDSASAKINGLSNSIRSRLGGSVSALGAKLRGANNRIQAMNRGLRGITSRLGGMGQLAGLGGLLSGAGATSFIKSFVDRGDKIGKFSRRIGQSVTDVQALRYVAGRTGVSVSVLDKSFTKLNTNLGMARRRTGTLYSGLKKVDSALLSQVLRAKNNREAFDLIIDRMQKAQTVNEAAAISYAAFGDRNGDMASMAEIGVKGIRALSDEAERFGLLSKESTDEAEIAADSFGRFSMSLTGLSNKIGAKLLPKLAPTIDRLTEWVGVNNDLIATKIDEFLNGIGDALKKLNIRQRIKDLKAFFGFLSKVSDAVGGFKGALALLGVFLGVKFVAALGAAAVAVKALGVAMHTNPILAFIGVLSIAAYMAYVHWDKIVAATKRAKDWISGALDSLWQKLEPLRNWFKTLWGNIENIGGGVIKIFEGLAAWDMDLVVSGIKQSFKGLKSFFTQLWDEIEKIFDFRIGRIDYRVNRLLDFKTRLAEEFGLKKPPAAPSYTPNGAAGAPAKQDGYTSFLDDSLLNMIPGLPAARLAAQGAGAAYRAFIGGKIDININGAPAGTTATYTPYPESEDLQMSVNLGPRSATVGGAF